MDDCATISIESIRKRCAELITEVREVRGELQLWLDIVDHMEFLESAPLEIKNPRVDGRPGSNFDVDGVIDRSFAVNTYDLQKLRRRCRACVNDVLSTLTADSRPLRVARLLFERELPPYILDYVSEIYGTFWLDEEWFPVQLAVLIEDEFVDFDASSLICGAFVLRCLHSALLEQVHDLGGVEPKRDESRKNQVTWIKWKIDEGMSYADIRKRHKEETGQKLSTGAITTAMKRLMIESYGEYCGEFERHAFDTPLDRLGDLVVATLCDDQAAAFTDITFGQKGTNVQSYLTKARWLNLANTQVTDDNLHRLSELANPRHLDLSNTQVTDAGLQHLSGLKNLQGLDLENTKVTDAGLQHLSGLNKLERLDLGDTQVTDAGLQHLSGLTNLQDLDLSDTQVTDAGADELQAQLSEADVVVWR